MDNASLDIYRSGLPKIAQGSVHRRDRQTKGFSELDQTDWGHEHITIGQPGSLRPVEQFAE